MGVGTVPGESPGARRRRLLTAGCCRLTADSCSFQRSEQLGGLDRLHEVRVEPGFQGATTVLGLPVAGDGDQVGAVAVKVLADLLRDLVAAETGKADVDEGHIGLALDGGPDTAGAVFSD